MRNAGRQTMFISRPDLIELTGLQRPSAIRRWLKRERIEYIDGADGWPRVLQSVVVARLGGKAETIKPEPRLRLRHA